MMNNNRLLLLSSVIGYLSIALYGMAIYADDHPVIAGLLTLLVVGCAVYAVIDHG